MAKTITTGIDVGTNQVRVVITEESRGKNKSFPKIIGTGIAQSRGLRHGYIINSSDVTKSVRAAVRDAERTSNVTVKHAYLSVGGVGLEEIRSRC